MEWTGNDIRDMIDVFSYLKNTCEVGVVDCFQCTVLHRRQEGSRFGFRIRGDVSPLLLEEFIYAEVSNRTSPGLRQKFSFNNGKET